MSKVHHFGALEKVEEENRFQQEWWQQLMLSGFYIKESMQNFIHTYMLLNMF